ncbi:hypothetical protein F5B21DRAFT_84025 [Xylaria acuta]|nr:hypothetical protein F5B21DRAFT_84025 [Xylaria acuta]
MLQKWTYIATESWQLGVLHKTLKLSDQGDIPGGHQEASPSAFKGDPETHPGWESKRLYDGEVIKPDEESWFSFHRKDRWLNWSNNAPLLGGGPWSIDNPLVWEVLSPSLECVNRILRALIQDQHPFLGTLLFGFIGPWNDVTRSLIPPGSPSLLAPFPNATVLLSYERYSQYRDTCDETLSVYMEQLPLLQPDDLTEKIEGLLATQMWSFHDVDTGYGITHPAYNSAISVHVGLLTQLMEGNITLAERCLLQFKLAAVILHETAHAITNNRVSEAFGDKKSQYWLHEPFMDFSGATEMGHYMDMAVWGGVFELGQRAGIDRPPLGFFSMNWPIADHCKSIRRGTFIEGHDEFADGKIIEKDLIPAEFASKMLSQSFWDDPEIPRKSDNFFHRTRLFISKTPYENNRAIVTYINPITIDPSLDLDQLTQTEKTMVRDWKEREALWNTVRTDWFLASYEKWDGTPWSIGFLRWFLSGFIDGHKRADIEFCSSAADTLVNSIPWWGSTSREEYIRHLEADNHYWIIHCVGLLMMASIPIRRDGELSPFEKNIRGPEHWLPSEKAQRAGRSGIELTTQQYMGGKPLSPSRFFNPFNPATAGTECTHFHFLNMVCEIIQHLAKAEKRLPTVWVTEIMRVESVLRQEHVARSKAALFSFEVHGAWSRSWYFEVPEYKPDLMSLWQGGQWVSV